MIRTLALGLLAASPALAQDLVPSPDLAPEVASLPRLAGEGDIVAKINASLAAMDHFDLDTVMCEGGSKAEDPARTVDTLSDGPEFLSFWIAMGSYCEGAAHPWWTQEFVTFDLRTGEEVDLVQFLPTTLLPASNRDGALAVLFLNEASDLTDACVGSYAWAIREGYLNFDLAVSKSPAGLLMWPYGLAYVETPCLEEVVIPYARLAEARVDARLLRAVAPD